MSVVTSIVEPLKSYLRRILSVKEQLEFLRISVDEVWGYGSLSISFVEDNKIDCKALAAKNGWKFERGAMIYQFSKMKEGPVVEFGIRPSNKGLKKLAAELEKKKNESQTS